MKRSILPFAITSLALFFITCSKDSEEAPEKKQNKAPNVFSLTLVANNATEIGLSPSFTWQKASDPDGDTVTYDFFLGTNTTPNTKVGSNLSTNQYQVASDLSEATTYYWSVTAKDGKGNNTSSEIFSFTTASPAANSAPGTFDLLMLENNTENAILTPSFSWMEAIDPDDDNITYDFLLSTDENPETVLAENIDETSYTLNDVLNNDTTYYWKVVAKDENGNTTSSEVFSFTTLANTPPLDFNLISVENEAISVDLLPTLVWQEAEDDDSVTYDIHLSLDNDPALLKQDIVDTSYELIENLFLNQTYYWKVVAKDDKGNSTESEIYSFTTKGLNLPSTPLTDSAAFSKRAGHTSLVFDNKIWVIGGYDGTNYHNDVWFSSDGINWTEATGNAPFSTRWKHASVVYDNKIWVIGGQSDDPTDTLVNLYYSDVWYSSNGVDWTMAVDNPFEERYGHTLTVFDGKMWVIGGYPSNFDTDNVWQSSNGVNWTLVNDNVPYGIDLRGHSAFEFQNELWMTNTYEDIWKTNNGTIWDLELEDSAFLRRVFASVESFDENLVYFSGRATFLCFYCKWWIL